MPASARPDAAVRVAAPAKVNLYLHILGRRPDGYHLLDSLVAFADVGDDIVARPAADLSLEILGPFADALPADGDNLALTAARRLADEFHVDHGAAITLTKNLPVAAGIGGGSADAAAVLKALCRLWDLAPDSEALSALGLSLGADVPVCLYGRSALMSGVGEIVAPGPALPECPVVLANPGVPVSTRDVFRRLARHSGLPEPPPIGFSDVAALAHALATRVNDLAEPAAAAAPEIDGVLDALSAAPANLLARLSGSGPTCFGLYSDSAAARAAAHRIAAAHPNWWVHSGILR